MTQENDCNNLNPVHLDAFQTPKKSTTISCKKASVAIGVTGVGGAGGAATAGGDRGSSGTAGAGGSMLRSNCCDSCEVKISWWKVDESTVATVATVATCNVVTCIYILVSSRLVLISWVGTVSDHKIFARETN